MVQTRAPKIYISSVMAAVVFMLYTCSVGYLIHIQRYRIQQYVQNNKESDNDWFRLESDKEGTRWFGKCWYIHELLKYEFDVEFYIPVTYSTTAPEIVLPELDGKNSKTVQVFIGDGKNEYLMDTKWYQQELAKRQYRGIRPANGQYFSGGSDMFVEGNWVWSSNLQPVYSTH